MNAMTLYTAEEFAEMGLDDGPRWELVRGRVHQVRDFPGRAHSYIVIEIAHAIRLYLDTNPIGAVLADVWFRTQRGPDTVRLPDMAFVTTERFHQMPEHKPGDVVPDLAIEVLSPSNRPKEITEKVGEYLAKGARLVWLIDPKTRSVAVFAPDALPYRLGPGECLDGDDVLPGFRLDVERIFRVPV